MIGRTDFNVDEDLDNAAMKSARQKEAFSAVLNQATRARLAGAARSEGRANIEQGRRELQERRGIIVTSGYFDETQRRVSTHRAGHSAKSAM